MLFLFVLYFHYSIKPEPRFCADSNPARGVLEIHDGEDLWQWSQMEVRLNAFRRSTIPQKQFIIIPHHHHHHHHHLFNNLLNKFIWHIDKASKCDGIISPSNIEQQPKILVTCVYPTFPLNGLIYFRFLLQLTW